MAAIIHWCILYALCAHGLMPCWLGWSLAVMASIEIGGVLDGLSILLGDPHPRGI